MSLKFEWGPKKAAANLSKHGVSFEEGLTVFADPLARIFDDEDHSDEECREISIGHAANNKQLLVVCFTARETAVRLFSARKASKMEHKDYEETVKP